ncbi:MAG: hypothetical protein V3V48_14970 [Candidatus Aminicenantaceae bacterium]
MVLREILEKIETAKTPIWLSDRKGDWNACDLLDRLSGPMLKRQAHLQPGLYIALINDGGYLGEVLYRVKQKG